MRHQPPSFYGTDCLAERIPCTQDYIPACPDIEDYYMHQGLYRYTEDSIHTGLHHGSQVAEELYQKGIISYPRTETDKYNSDMDLQALVQHQAASATWGTYASELIHSNKFKWPRDGGHNDEAHPPIHPLQCTSNFDSDDHRRLYELITRHFLATCSDDAIGYETTIELQIVDEVFSTTGRMVTARNWLDVMSPFESWPGKTLPVFHLDEVFTPDELVMTDGRTIAPSHLSEAELLSLMEKHEIGTDATTAQHIATIQKRGYATKTHNQQFVPSEVGMALVEGYNQMEVALSKPHLRARMEAMMKKICVGEMSKVDVVKECVRLMRDTFREVITQAAMLDAAFSQRLNRTDFLSWTIVEPHSAKCGRCLQEMQLRQHAERRALYCVACAAGYDLPGKGSISPHTHQCPICKFQVLRITTERNTDYFTCPWCYKNPPSEQQIESENFLSGFRCFQCKHTECALATSSSGPPIRPCSKCTDGKLVLKKLKDGKSWVASCDKFPACKVSVYFPRFIQHIDVITVGCPSCTPVECRLLDLRMSNRNLPPGVPHEHRGCIGGCDQLLNSHCENIVPVHRRPVGAASSANVMPQPNSDSRRADGRSQVGRTNRGGDVVGGGDETDFRSWLNSAPQPNKKARPNQSTAQIEAPRCSGHGEECATRNVSKEGPNKGRAFFVCPRPRAEQCSFFEWADATSNAAPSFSRYESHAHSAPSYSSSGPASIGSHSSIDPSNTSVPRCPGHDLPARELTVNKEGPNKGRRFFSCPKPQDERCNFFQWADDAPNVQQQPSSRSTGPTNVCFKCNQPGHYANACPGGGNTATHGGFQPSSRSTGPTNVCFKCNQPGHYANACPGGGNTATHGGFQPSSRSTGPTNVCFKCNQPGHYASVCPSSKENAANQRWR